MTRGGSNTALPAAPRLLRLRLALRILFRLRVLLSSLGHRRLKRNSSGASGGGPRKLLDVLQALR